MTLTDGEKALALQMFSVQHMKQADIAAHFGVSQSAISYLTRRALGAQTGQRVPRIDPNLPATMLREAAVQLSNHITDLEALLGRARSTLAMLRQTPEPTSRPADPTTQLAYLLQHPSEELGPLWSGEDDPIMFHGGGLPQEVADRAYPSGGIPVPVWAQAFPYTLVAVPGNGAGDCITIEGVLTEYLDYVEKVEHPDGISMPFCLECLDEGCDQCPPTPLLTVKQMEDTVRAEVLSPPSVEEWHGLPLNEPPYHADLHGVGSGHPYIQKYSPPYHADLHGVGSGHPYIQKYSPPFDTEERARAFMGFLELKGIVGGLGTDGDKFLVQWTEPA